MKLKLIKPTKVLGSKPERSNWCTYEPTILFSLQSVNNYIKTIVSMYIHHKMGNACLPIPPKYLPGVENKYGGLIFNAQI